MGLLLELDCKKQKIQILDWFHKNLQENEFSRLNQGLDNLGQFWKEPEEKGSKVFCVKTTQEKKNWVESAAEKPKDPFRQRPFKIYVEQTSFYILL